MVDLASLKSYADRLDIDKLETTRTDLGKLNNVIENDICLKSLMLFRQMIPLIQLKKAGYSTKMAEI